MAVVILLRLSRNGERNLQAPNVDHIFYSKTYLKLKINFPCETSLDIGNGINNAPLSIAKCYLISPDLWRISRLILKLS